jgi:DNA repair ATPase RecN
VNKKKCQQLGERIETICETLKPLQEPTFISSNIRITLDRFCNFIDECTDFVRKFVDVPLYKRLYARRTYNDEFERYDKELSNYNNHLQLDIQIAMKNNLNEIIGTMNETQNAIDEYTIHLAERINTTTENLTALSNRTDMITTTLNELREDMFNFAQIIHLYGLQLKQNIEVHQQILTHIAEKNKKHSGIFRRVKKVFKN